MSKRSLVHVGSGALLPTNEDWHPTFPGDVVQANIFPLGNGQWRVLVRGADDTGYERDCESEARAWAVYRRIPIPVSKRGLIEAGFVHM